MKDIKFKAKTVGGEWVIGNYAHIKKDFSTVKKGHYISNSAGAPFAYLVRPETIGQLTPFVDIHKKKVFIGDLICDVIVGLVSQVVFTDYGNIGLRPVNNKVKDLEYETIDPSWFCTTAEVVGNVHNTKT